MERSFIWRERLHREVQDPWESDLSYDVFEHITLIDSNRKLRKLQLLNLLL